MNKVISNDIRFYQKKQYIKIREFFVNKKYNNVIKEATCYLKEYPNDINMMFMRAKSYRYLEMYDEAILDLQYDLNNEYMIVELFYIYYFMNKYKEAMELLPVLYEKQYLRINSLEICELVMKKALGIDISCEKVRNTEIVKKQM